jgi:1-acyl-sn-glycerol-3-phosphate acyltransferase
VIVLLFLRTILGIPLITLAMMGHALFIGLSGETDFSEAVLRSWCRFFNWVAGARVQRIGGGDLDPKKSYVFVSNHTSNLDVPAILSVTPTPLRFIAKRELTRLPLFGWAARRMGHVFIDRGDKHAATRAIRSRIERGFDQGVALFFFAEGTRSTTSELLPFKKGAAIAAIETALDVVPIGIAGAREVMAPKGFSLFRPGPIAVAFGPPISVAGHTLDERDDLVALQRAAVEKCVAAAQAALKAPAKAG